MKIIISKSLCDSIPIELLVAYSKEKNLKLYCYIDLLTRIEEINVNTLKNKPDYSLDGYLVSFYPLVDEIDIMRHVINFAYQNEADLSLRIDKIFIKLVEEYNEINKIHLKVIDIPDDLIYEIESEEDGTEYIREISRVYS